MSDDLEAQVRNWLAKTGFPLELRIGRRFQSASWSVTYSRWYRDPETQKHRELDVQATVAGVQKRSATVSFSLCIECKSSSKPWVALGAGNTLEEEFLDNFVVGSGSQMTLVGARSEHIEVPRLLPPDTPLVNGLVQAELGQTQAAKTHSEKDLPSPTSPYSAIRQVRSAALALSGEAEGTAIQAAGRTDLASLFVPLVVFDGSLFEYSLDQQLKDQLRAVEAVVVSVPDDAENTTALVPVVTGSFAEQLAASLHAPAHNFCVAMLPYASLVAGALAMGTIPGEASAADADV